MNLLELANAPKDLGESMILYGPPKGGKTELVGSLAEVFNLKIFDLENGIKTLINSTRIPAEWKARIDVIQIPDTKMNPVAIETMLKVLTGERVTICRKHGKVMCLDCIRLKLPMHPPFCVKDLTQKDILVVEGLSQISDSAYNQVVGSSIDPTLEWKHYDAWNQRIAMCLSMIQQAPYHVLFTGHAKMLEQSDGSEKLTPIGGTKAFSTNVARYFGHVLYAEPKAGKFLVGSRQDYAANIIIGSRADLQYGKDGIKLVDFFLTPKEVKDRIEAAKPKPVVLQPQTTPQK